MTDENKVSGKVCERNLLHGEMSYENKVSGKVSEGKYFEGQIAAKLYWLAHNGHGLAMWRYLKIVSP